MEKDLRILEDLKAQIDKGSANFKKAPKERITESYIKARLEVVENQHEKLASQHRAIISNYSKKALAEFKSTEFDLFDEGCEAYLRYKGELNEALKTITPSSKETSASTSHGDCNNKISIPLFNGNYSDWSSFKDEAITRFRELESEPSPPPQRILSPEELACENHFKATTRRDEDGRYIVELPFRLNTINDYGDTRYPLGAYRVGTDFYMDDLLTGCQTEEEALLIYEEMNTLLKKGGFILQKWSSNKIGLLAQEGESNMMTRKFKEDEITKVVGLNWNRRSNNFVYSVNLSFEEAIPETKRQIMDEICRVYDPGGSSSFDIRSFSVGEPLLMPPDYNHELTTTSSLRRWQVTKRITQQFWKRWSQEYLT